MKRHIIPFWDFINENEAPREYGCLMAYFDFPQVNEIHSIIKPEDVHTDSDGSKGLEKETHITLLYGIHHDEVPSDKVFGTTEGIEIGPVTLKNVSIFDNDKYDVLKFDAENENLHKINERLKEYPHTTTFPDYHPHSTIGYLKKGTGKKYVDMLKDKEYVITPARFVYSKPDGEKYYKEITDGQSRQ